MVWVKYAPEYGVDGDNQVCDFIDQYVSCELPKQDGKLRELVLLLQQHKHSSYCKRNKSYRFNFPKPPSPKTLITKPNEHDDIAHDVAVLSKVQKLIAEGNTNMSLDDLLDKAEVTETEYIHALEVSSKGNVVVLRRKPNECSINNYNPSVMLAWQANMDIQFVLYACVMYVASYIMKTERSMGELLKRPHAAPLAKYEVVFLAKGKRGSEIIRLQFPLTLAWATTIHKVQGLTLDEIVVDMKGGRFSPGQAYVAFSRVKTLTGLHIFNFNSQAIKKSIDVENEMVRLNNNVLPPMPQVFCDSASHLTIALLNVRSLVSKLQDIMCDSSLKSASILCFCETWLNATQSSPVLLNNQIDIRCDRITGENKGVLICVPSHMNPCNAQRFATNGIEAVSVTLQLPNDNHSIQIALVYRSPNVSQTSLTVVLTRLLQHVTLCNTPCIILGDFNEDILNHPNSSIDRLISIYGFTQLVKSPSTPQGTLLDHVYYKNENASSNIVIKVHYSDHDTVYFNIPFCDV